MSHPRIVDPKITVLGGEHVGGFSGPRGSRLWAASRPGRLYDHWLAGNGLFEDSMTSWLGTCSFKFGVVLSWDHQLQTRILYHGKPFSYPDRKILI